MLGILRAMLIVALVLVSAGRAAEQADALRERAAKAVSEAAAAKPGEERDRLRKEAQGLYEQALKHYAARESETEAKLRFDGAFIDPSDVKKLEAREKDRADAIQALLFTAGTLLEMHEAYPPDSPESKDCLQQAADKFEKIYQRFRTRLAGQLARVKQGECYAKLGDTRRALGYWRDVLQQPDEITALRPLKASAMRLSLECWLGPQENRVELAAQEGERFLVNTQKAETPRLDFLAIRYYTATAYHRHFKSLPAAEADFVRADLDLALEHAEQVAEHPSPFQEPAKKLVADLRALGAKAP